MKIARIASALAASVLMAAPVAAEAGTRASSSATYPAASYSASRASTSVEAENDLKGAAWILILLAGGAAAYGLSRALETKSSGA